VWFWCQNGFNWRDQGSFWEVGVVDLAQGVFDVTTRKKISGGIQCTVVSKISSCSGREGAAALVVQHWCRFQGSRKLPALVTRATAQAVSRRRMQVLAARFQCPNRASRIATKLHFLKLWTKTADPTSTGVETLRLKTELLPQLPSSTKHHTVTSGRDILH
jgi:hypothetical protein